MNWRTRGKNAIKTARNVSGATFLHGTSQTTGMRKMSAHFLIVLDRDRQTQLSPDPRSAQRVSDDLLDRNPKAQDLIKLCEFSIYCIRLRKVEDNCDYTKLKLYQNWERSTNYALRMMHWWCTNDAVRMHWGFPDDALMVHWWYADDSVMMHW